LVAIGGAPLFRRLLTEPGLVAGVLGTRALTMEMSIAEPRKQWFVAKGGDDPLPHDDGGDQNEEEALE